MKFPLSCGTCGSPNPMMANFCLNCGAEIEEKDTQNFIHNIDVLSENRKNVAVIFADVSGFTALSEKMDPEEVREIINSCFDYITKPVYELEGTIDKYIGDCVMILFGAKYPHADDSLRAVICAMRMMELINQFSKEMLHSKGISLSLSIGINYGLVVTGRVGNYFDKDYTVMGDTVNTAQRLQSNAGRGEILASQSVYLETKDAVKYSDMREITVKNKEKPVKCYAPLSMIKVSGKSDFELIERDNEINLLNSIFLSDEQSKAIAVIGEAGIGKTSLAKKFVSALGSDVRVVWIDCDPMYQKRVYYSVSNILFNVANISREAGSSTMKARLISYVEYILKDYTEEKIQKNYEFLSLIMGLDRSKDFQNILNSMRYEDIKRELINQLSIFIAALCKEQEIVFIVDDIQYADSGSLTLLRGLLKSLAHVKFTLIFNSAYEIELLNSPDSTTTHRLELKRLSKAGVNQLLFSLLGCNNIDQGLLDKLYQLTNGNPLFVKEYINIFKREEKYVIKEDTAYLNSQEAILLPNNIEGIILSNLSWLDAKTTRFIQAASVVGKEFSLSWVKSILDVEVDEAESLELPIQLNIISLKAVRTISGMVDRVYMFERDVVRDVIYDSILNRDKKLFHKKLTEMIESKYSGGLEHYYEILCLNYEAAGLNRKAGDYYLKSALKQKNDFNYGSALEYYDKLLQQQNVNVEEIDKSRLLHAYMDIGNIYSLMTEYDKALEFLDKALEVADLTDDIYSIKLMIVNIYKEKAQYNEALAIIEEMEHKIRKNSSIYGKLLQLKCSILRVQGNSEAFVIAEQSEEILLRNKDFENLSETLRQAGILYHIKGDMENGAYFMNKAYGYAERIDNLRVMGMASANLGIIYYTLGMPSKAQEYFNKSIEISKKTSHIQNYISNSSNLGILYLDKGLFCKAEALFMEALEKAGQVMSMRKLCISQLNLGDLNYETGDFDKALEHYSKSLDMAENLGLPVEEAINYLGVVRLDLKSGALEKVPGILEKAYEIFKEAEEIAYISDYFRYRSIYELQTNNSEDALELCEKSVSVALEANNDMKRLKALRLKGNILTHKGIFEEALKCYDESINLAIQLESDYEAAKGYYRKYTAMCQMNRFEDAEKCLASAKAAVDKIDKCRWTSIIYKK
ncbi:MAG: tetratricopeptide repeat protein [Clostridia bacterium]